MRTVASVRRFVGGLSGLHGYFTSRNKSTYEHFRSRAGSHDNPYDVNCIRNWGQVSHAPLLALIDQNIGRDLPSHTRPSVWAPIARQWLLGPWLAR